MLVDATKEVGAAMYIEHNSFPLLAASGPFLEIPSHLNPFSLQCIALAPPLPPLLTTNLVNAMVAKLGNECIRSSRQSLLVDGDLVDFDPPRTRYPLGGEALDVFNSVLGGVGEEVTNQIDPFMVGYMSGRLLAKRLAIKVLQECKQKAQVFQPRPRYEHARSMFQQR